MLHRTALVIEDDPTCSELIQMVLQRVPGLAVLAVTNAADARDSLAGSQAYALIVTDVNLPGEDGLSFVQALRELPDRSAVPVIVTTSSCDKEIRRRADSIGVQAFFEKPFSPSQFLKAVNSILNGTS
jgi:CheY-like chemotaxis protein